MVNHIINKQKLDMLYLTLFCEALIEAGYFDILQLVWRSEQLRLNNPCDSPSQRAIRFNLVP